MQKKKCLAKRIFFKVILAEIQNGFPKYCVGKIKNKKMRLKPGMLRTFLKVIDNTKKIIFINP